MNNFGTNNRKQLEEQFKNKFENAQFSPPAHLWEQIDAALDAKPWYKRPLFYWTSGLVAALLLVVMFWFTLVYDNSNTPSNNDVANSDKIENTQNNIDNNTENSSSKNEGIRTIQTPNDTAFGNVEANNPTQKTEWVSKSDTKKIHSNSSHKNNSDKNSTFSQNTSTNTSKENTDVAISISLNDKDKNKNKDLDTNSNLDEVIAEANDTLELVVLKEIDWSKYLPVGNPYFEKEVILKMDSTNEAIASNQESENPTENIKKSSGIAITFGINHTQGVYKPTFRTDSLHSGLTVIEAYSSNLADTLPKTNISGTYQQTGFDVALQFGKDKRWSINTGLGMGKANYSFSSTNYVRIYVDLTDPLNLREYPNNQVEAKYEWLQLPIAIGYQFGESRVKKFSGFAQLGTAIEFLSSYSYTSLNPDVIFTYALGNHRTTNTQVWTQAGINYHITNRWTLWGGGTYKSSLSSLINENGVTFSSQAYGWQVGTRFTIFKSGK
ncbi:outer membrane beta-barrel protein [Bernardetia sp. Wsw4-3y2]|uniref:outer membrane beta-barrel protein n=1 Tax=Bernardetia sp. Wsw4-3y2 TaxID=3127471 RepID=UPI0030CF76C0